MQTVDIEVFATGTWGGLTWTEGDLDQMVANFTALAPYIKPPVKLGHNDEQPLAQKDGQPAFGWVSGLRRMGSKLIATVADMPAKLRDLIDKRAYRRLSSEIYPEWEGTGAEANLKSGVVGKVLSAVALLGADIPEVKTLDDLHALFAIEAGGLVLAGATDGAQWFSAVPEPAPIAGARVAAPHASTPSKEPTGAAEDDMDEAAVKAMIEEATKATADAVRAEVKAEMAETVAAKDAELKRLTDANAALTSRVDHADKLRLRAEADQWVAARCTKDNYRLFPKQQIAAALLYEKLGGDVLVTAAEGAERKLFTEKETPTDLSAKDLLIALVDQYPPQTKLLAEQGRVDAKAETLDTALTRVAEREKLSLTKHDERTRALEIVQREHPELIPAYGSRAAH